MADVCIVNGVSLNTDTSTYEPERQGEDTRGEAGRLRRTIRTTKRRYNFRTTLYSATYAEAVRNLVSGRGDTWSFRATSPDDPLFSGRGTLSAGDGTVVLDPLSSEPVLQVVDLTSHTFYVGLGSEWTIMLYRANYGSPYNHYCLNSAGQKWEDSVRNDALSTPWVALDISNNVVLSSSGADYLFADMVILPYTLPADWQQAQVDWAFSTPVSPFPALPKVYLEGATARTSSTVVCLGLDGASEQVMTASTSLYERVPFILREV